jgi:hypothetical protein
MKTKKEFDKGKWEMLTFEAPLTTSWMPLNSIYITDGYIIMYFGRDTKMIDITRICKRMNIELTDGEIEDYKATVNGL